MVKKKTQTNETVFKNGFENCFKTFSTFVQNVFFFEGAWHLARRTSRDSEQLVCLGEVSVFYHELPFLEQGHRCTRSSEFKRDGHEQSDGQIYRMGRLHVARRVRQTRSGARIVSGLSLRTSTTSADHWKHEAHPVLRPVDAPRPPAAPGALAAGAPPAVALDAAALPPAAEADVEEDPEEEQLPLELLRSTKEWKGWRVSYCKLESDAVQAERFRKYLSKLSASVGDPADAQRYKTVEHKNNARLKTKQLVSERSKARSSFLRLKRAA